MVELKFSTAARGRPRGPRCCRCGRPGTVDAAVKLVRPLGSRSAPARPPTRTTNVVELKLFTAAPNQKPPSRTSGMATYKAFRPASSPDKLWNSLSSTLMLPSVRLLCASSMACRPPGCNVTDTTTIAQRYASNATAHKFPCLRATRTYAHAHRHASTCTHYATTVETPLSKNHPAQQCWNCVQTVFRELRSSVNEKKLDTQMCVPTSPPHLRTCRPSPVAPRLPRPASSCSLVRHRCLCAGGAGARNAD